jgi:hypothetical protein
MGNPLKIGPIVGDNVMATIQIPEEPRVQYQKHPYPRAQYRILSAPDQLGQQTPPHPV